MGYIFAGAIFDLLHIGIITEIAQLVLFWLALNYMRKFSPLFDKAVPWLLAVICIYLLFWIGAASAQVTIILQTVPVLNIAQSVAWLGFWYLVLRAIESLESVYGDLHSRILFQLYYVDIGLFLASYAVIFIGLFVPMLMGGLAILLAIAQIVVTILQLVYLYRAWKDFNSRREELGRFSYDTFSEEKK